MNDFKGTSLKRNLKPLRQKPSTTGKDVESTISEEQKLKILEIRVLMKERDEARLGGNYGKADTMRERLEKKYDIEIIDQKDGPSGWKFKDGSPNKLPPGTAVPDEFQQLLQGNSSKKRGRDDERAESADDNKQASKKQKNATTPATTSSTKKAASTNNEIERNRSLVASLTGSSSSARNVNGVIIEEIREGQGLPAKSGDRLQVQYVGRLKSNNKIFDSSKRPFTFHLGRSEVIKGWDIGCSGMKIGGQRKLTIPPEKAYGKSGAPPAIPPNATLVFDVTLVGMR